MNDASRIECCESLLEEMVSFDTVNLRFGGPAGGESRLAMHLEQRAALWGLQTRRLPVGGHEFNLLVFHEPQNPEGGWMLFESHLDTVSVAGMSVPPFAMSRDSRRLWGRGVCDTKGSGAAMLTALCEYARSPSGRRRIGVLFTIDEESGMNGASAFAKNDIPNWRDGIEGMLVGEPTGLRPVAAHNGVARWTTTTRGVAAHSADPSLGISAISAMVKIISYLEPTYARELAQRKDPLTGAAACSINVIRGGTQVNIIPDRCEIEIDRRLIPGETLEGAIIERDRLFALASDRIQVEHTPAYYIPPLGAEGNRKLCSVIAPSLQSLGLNPMPVGARYVTNASHYAAAGTPVLVIGPGHIAQAHTADEWIDRWQLQLATELYLAVMLSRTP